MWVPVEPWRCIDGDKGAEREAVQLAGDGGESAAGGERGRNRVCNGDLIHGGRRCEWNILWLFWDDRDCRAECAGAGYVDSGAVGGDDAAEFDE